jgi:hypothetical protein
MTNDVMTFSTNTELTSVQDRALDAGALFQPLVAPITLPNGTIPRVASGSNKGLPEASIVYRETADGEQYLLNDGVKPGYCAESYGLLVQSADAIFPNTCETLTVAGHGRKLMFTQRIGEAVDNGELLGNYLMYVGSLDSTWATGVYSFVSRPFCSNQIATGMRQVTQKRTRNHDLLYFTKSQVLAESVGVFDTYIATAGLLRSVKLDQSAYRRLRDSALPKLADDAGPRAITMADKRIAGIDYFWQEELDAGNGANAYSLYQAVQSYEYHVATKGRTINQAEVVRDPARRSPLSESVKAAALALV